MIPCSLTLIQGKIGGQISCRQCLLTLYVSQLACRYWGSKVWESFPIDDVFFYLGCQQWGHHHQADLLSGTSTRWNFRLASSYMAFPSCWAASNILPSWQSAFILVPWSEGFLPPPHHAMAMSYFWQSAQLFPIALRLRSYGPEEEELSQSCDERTVANKRDFNVKQVHLRLQKHMLNRAMVNHSFLKIVQNFSSTDCTLVKTPKPRYG